MNTKKVSELNQLAGADIANGDMIPLLDVSVGELKKAALQDLTLKGDKGDTGLTGAQGTQGAKGDKGDTGNTGATGATGAQGIQGVKGDKAVNWKGAYVGGTSYVIDDAVSYNGSSYVCILASTGNLPTNGTYWNVLASKGNDGVGTGDVSGPVSATDNHIATFDLATGKLIKDSGLLLSQVDVHGATAKATPVDADELGLIDSAASWVLKKVTLANFRKAILNFLEVPADTIYSGITITMTAGEDLVDGDVVYFKSDGKVWKVDADAIATMPAMGMAMATISANATGIILLQGIYRNDALYNWTVGGLLYASGTAGGATQTQPAGADGVVQVIGIATHADRIYFNPVLTYVTHI